MSINSSKINQNDAIILRNSYLKMYYILSTKVVFTDIYEGRVSTKPMERDEIEGIVQEGGANIARQLQTHRTDQLHI